MSDDKDSLTSHDYDGIQEYDNPLPSWWLITFFGTIIFAFLYWIHYEFGGAPTQLAELQGDMTKITALNQAIPASAVESEDVLKSLLADKNLLVKGREIFLSKCAACHGNELQGGIGPNLVDEFWLHGQGQMKDIMLTVRKGVPDKGMPPWETLLKDDELKSVVALIAASQGTKPANAKGPQGEHIGHP